MDVQILASGSSGNCYRITDGKTPLLLEAGIPFKQIQRGLSFQIFTVAATLITHEHMDHAKAVADLVRAGIDIYASQGTLDALKLSGHRCHAARAMEQFKIGTWTILPFDAVHDCKEPLGYLLASKDIKLLYLTDSAYCKYRFAGLTHLMIEANYSMDVLNQNIQDGVILAEMKRRLLKSHMSIQTCLQFLKANDLSKVRQVYLLHLSQDNSLAEQFKRHVQEITGKEVIVA